MNMCEWCGNEIEIDNGEVEINGMHEICHRSAKREAVISSDVEKDYDPQS